MVCVEKVENKEKLQTVFAIREEVFVQEQQVPREEEYDSFEETAQHYLASCNDQPCGTARWRSTANGVKLERFAVLKSFRNREVGSAILKQVLADVRQAHPEQTVYLHAQVPAMNFYSRHGFSPVGEKFLECDIEHFKMIYKG